MEQIKAMLEEMGKDSVFAEEMQPLMEKGGVAAIVAAAAKKGFIFTEADYNDYLEWGKTLNTGIKSGVLTEEDLETVSGGSGGTPGNPWRSGCWVDYSGDPEFRDGMERMRCGAPVCRTWLMAEYGAGWYACCCWGSDRCKNGWHKWEPGHRCRYGM